MKGELKQMKTINASIDLYTYDELSQEAKEKAFEEHKDFLDSRSEEIEDENGDIKREWIDHDRETVEDSLKINEYWFFSNGEMAHCVTYTDGHEKKGITEFKFLDKVYQI